MHNCGSAFVSSGLVTPVDILLPIRRILMPDINIVELLSIFSFHRHQTSLQAFTFTLIVKIILLIYKIGKNITKICIVLYSYYSLSDILVQISLQYIQNVFAKQPSSWSKETCKYKIVFDFNDTFSYSRKTLITNSPSIRS